MELYVLDSLLRRSTVVDSFDSVVWTERFNDIGDATVNIHSTLSNRNLLTTGTLLASNKSRRVMRIDTVEDKVGTDGTKTLVLTCSSIENLLDDRVARDTLATGGTAEPNWVLTGLPAAIGRQIFQNVLVDCLLDPGDALPFYTVGNMYPADTIVEPTDSVTMSIPLQSVLTAIKTLCQTYDLGFRITRNFDTSQLFFNIYSGNDRTSGQTVNAPVIFAPNLDNLLNSSYLTSSKQYKNVCYIVCPDASAIVYGDRIDPTVQGFLRRVLFLSVTDIAYPDRTIGPAYTVTTSQQTSIKAAQSLSTTVQAQSDSLAKLTSMKRLLTVDLANISAVTGLAGSALTTAQKTDITNAVNTSNAYNPTEDAAINVLLKARGLQELAKYNNVTAFDGQIPQIGSYTYDVDYTLGDILEVRNEDGIVNNVRVTEQIFSQDASGEKSYPTLSSRLVISPGVWASWDANQEWAQVPDTEHWADLP